MKTWALYSSRASGASGAEVKREAFETLDEDERAWIVSLAVVVTDMVEQGAVKDAVEDIDYAIPEIGEKRPDKAVEYKVALWGRLDSKTRTAITKYRNSLKGKA